jgi:LacI family transcriptional regulator
MSTIVQVAERAGVSTATVSNVIRGTRKVSEDLTNRVQAAIEELNYSPNEIARSLKVKQTRMLAMVLPDITNPFFPEMIRGAEDAAFDRGYFLLTANTNEQADRERRIVAALRAYRVDGVLLATAQSSFDHDVTHIANIVRAGVSVVCLDRSVPDVPTDAVLLDNVGGARECVGHLIERGHRRIAIITGALRLQTGHERLKGYKMALASAGIALDPKLIFEGDFRYASGKLCCSQAMQRKSPPTAIFICNGLMTLGALQALDEMKIACPEGVALATFDEITADRAFHTQITTIVQPSYEMGHRATTILLDRIEGRLGPKEVVVRVTPKLEVRASSELMRRKGGGKRHARPA